MAADREEQRLRRHGAQQDISVTGTAVWAVREDGQLLSNHVERAALEQLQRLSRST
jgi:hypothetical protein